MTGHTYTITIANLQRASHVTHTPISKSKAIDVTIIRNDTKHAIPINTIKV
jgi:hypothetical protein